MTDLSASATATTSATATASESAPLSQSAVFPWLREFYATSGVKAWAGTVPLYVTCNPDIAHSYADVIVRFIQDAAAAGQLDPSEPVYVAELGAGSGKFGFHLVRRLRELRALLGMEDIRIVHVMSDVAEANIDHWRGHRRLRPFVERGELVFARFDVETDAAFHLMPLAPRDPPAASPNGPGGEGTAGRTEEHGQLAAFRNPLIVIANYVFDCLPQDLFRASDGRIDQMLAALSDGDASDAARLTWTAHPVTLPHYGDDDLDAVLADIASQPGEATIMFPVTAMRAVRRLADAAGGRLCLLASDLGTSYGLAPEPELQVSREKSFFYLPVDLSVMGRLFQRLGPGIQKHRPSTYLDTALFISGIEADQLRETAYAFSATVEAFGVRGRKALTSLLEEGGAKLGPEEWLAVANLGWYDSRFLDASVDLFGRWVRQKALPPPLHREVVMALRLFAAEIYWTPGAPDTYFNMATALAELGELKAAVASYVLSIETVGPAADTYLNLALALRALDRRPDAVEALRDALSLDPSHVPARGWLGRIELEITGELPPTPAKPGPSTPGAL